MSFRSTLIALGKRSVWKGRLDTSARFIRSEFITRIRRTHHYVPVTNAIVGPFFTPLPAGNDVKTMQRSSTILPSLVGRKIQVHNGKTYIEVFISEAMVGRKFGEFAVTRKPFTYKKKEGR